MDLFHEFGTVHDVARYLNISPRRVQILVKKGVLPRGKRGEYELLPCLHAYTAHLKKGLFKMSGSNASKARMIYYMNLKDGSTEPRKAGR